MEKQVKNILSRLKKINQTIQQPSFNNKNNNKKQTTLDRELLKKIILTLEKVIEYIKKEK